MKLNLAKVTVPAISLCLSLVLAPFSLLANALAQGSNTATHRGLKLVQTTEASGVYDVWVSADAIRVYSRSNDYYIAAQAPTWQIQVWRPDRKQFAQMSFEKFMKSDVLVANQFSYLAELTKPSRTEKVVRGKDKLLISYFPAIETVNGSGLFISDREDGNGLKGGQKLRPQVISFDNDYPSQVSQIIGKIYNLPKLKGFPISSFALTQNNKTDALLNCVIASRNFEFKTVALHAPENYKKTTLDKKMFYTANQYGVLDEMTAN